eukprot:10978063-Alexandrium_andersonii.AAC.1
MDAWLLRKPKWDSRIYAWRMSDVQIFGGNDDVDLWCRCNASSKNNQWIKLDQDSVVDLVKSRNAKNSLTALLAPSSAAPSAGSSSSAPTGIAQAPPQPHPLPEGPASDQQGHLPEQHGPPHPQPEGPA